MKRILVLENYSFGKNYLKAAKNIGFETILATSTPKNKLSSEDLKNSDYILQVDISDFNNTINSIIEYYKLVPFDGALAGHVFLMPQIAAITDKLSLTTFGFKGAYATTFKDETSKILEKENLSKYKFWIIESLEDLEFKKNTLKYPCIIKPIDGFASINIFKAENFEELKNAYKKHIKNRNYGSLSKVFSSKVLIQEFIDGKEYSVESIVEDSVVKNITITEKLLDEKHQFVEIGHILPANNLLYSDKVKILEYINQIHRAFNINTGITHTEIKINDNGVFLIELNPRVAGGGIPNILSKILNRNIYEIAVRNCVGEKQFEKIKTTGYGYVKFATAKSSGKIKKICGINKNSGYSIDLKHVEGDIIPSVIDNRCLVVEVAAYHKSDINYLKSLIDNVVDNIEILVE